MDQIVNFVPHGFCHVTMAGEGFKARTRAKDVMIFPLDQELDGATHQLRFFDCGWGAIRQLPGTVSEMESERIVFKVCEGKEFIIEPITRPQG